MIRKKINKWLGHKVYNAKTGENEWKMKRDQKTRNYRKKTLKGGHVYKPKSGRWTKDVKRSVDNFEKKREQIRRSEKKVGR
jgi:hypothetical protein